MTDWRGTLTKLKRQAIKFDKMPKSTIEASALLAETPLQWLSLIGAMPYPELVLAAMPRTTLERVGKEMVVRARVQLLDEIIDTKGAATARQIASGWKAAIITADDAEIKWVLARDKDRWAWLGDADSADAGTLTLEGAEHGDYCRILAVVIALHQRSQPSTSGMDLPHDVRRVMRWLSNPSAASLARDTLAELRNANWTSAGSLTRSYASDAFAADVADGSTVRADGGAPAAGRR